jgi:hypothetical protein
LILDSAAHSRARLDPTASTNAGAHPMAKKAKKAKAAPKKKAAKKKK